MTLCIICNLYRKSHNLIRTKFRLFQFRSPLLSESFIYFLFVLLLRCFSSQAFLRTDYVFICGLLSFNSTGFPHSDSRGSRPFSSSPRLFAALHVLRRLSMPRHPPLALCSFTYLWSSFTSYFRFHWWLRLSLLQQPYGCRFWYTLIILCNFQCTTNVLHTGNKIVQELLLIQPPLYSKGFWGFLNNITSQASTLEMSAFFYPSACAIKDCSVPSAIASVTTAVFLNLHSLNLLVFAFAKPTPLSSFR